MSNTIIIWVCVTILVFIFLGIYKVVKRYFINPLMKDKDATLGTPLTAFRESDKYDTLIRGAGRKVVVSISQLFETMCILDPCTYEDDPNITTVIKNYKDLLKGRILDPEAIHAPSEYLEGISNNDYLVYLKAQVKALGKAGKDVSWFKDELKRFSNVEKEELFEADFMINLMGMGAPENLLSSIINEKRMENFSPEDWKELVAKVNEYAEQYTSIDISFFLELVDDKAILFDGDKMEAFHQLRDLGVDNELAAAYIRKDMSSEDLAEVSDMIDKYGLNCEEALEKLVTSKKSKLKKETLKRSYKERIITG